MRHDKYRADHARGKPSGDIELSDVDPGEELCELGNVETAIVQSTDGVSEANLKRFEQRLGTIANLMKGQLKSQCPDISETIGKYTLLSLMCSRGPSFVFQAIDEQLNRLVVIKIYRNGCTDAARECLLNEARTMSRVNSPYVAKCIEVTEHEGLPFMVLEHVSGIDLGQFIATHEVGVDLAIDLMKQIAEGMKEVHAKGVLHLDLKPSNVLLLPSGDIKIIDFGLAQPMQELKRDNRSGTIAYMPPERAKNEIGLVGPASDVFGIGTIFYSLLTGRAPFEANSKPRIFKKAVAGKIVSPRSLVHGIPKSVDRLCMKCLAQNVYDRFRSVESFLSALESVSAGIERNRIYKRFSYAVSAGLAATVAVLLCIPASEKGVPSYDAAASNSVVQRSSNFSQKRFLPRLPNYYGMPQRTSTRSR